jgi:hypothetical protein
MIRLTVGWSPFPDNNETRIHSLRWRSSTSVNSCSNGHCGGERQAREKSLLRADDGEAHGCRLLLAGAVMASTANPLPLASGDTLCPACRNMQRRCHGIITSLGVLQEFLGSV